MNKQKRNYRIVNYKRFVASMIVLIVTISIGIESIVTRVIAQPTQTITVIDTVSEPQETKPQVASEAVQDSIKLSSTQASRGSNQHSEDVMLLAKVIMGEAEGESYGGKLAVGTVVVNRIKSPDTNRYGGPTLKGVVYKEGQFNCVDRGSFNRLSPNKDSIEAAKQVLEYGYRSFGPDILYYFNPTTAGDRAFIRSVNIVMTIGHHQFGK